MWWPGAVPQLCLDIEASAGVADPAAELHRAERRRMRLVANVISEIWCAHPDLLLPNGVALFSGLVHHQVLPTIDGYHTHVCAAAWCRMSRLVATTLPKARLC